MVPRTSFCNSGGCGLNVLASEIWAASTAAEDNMDILVSAGLDNSGKALFGHTHEGVWV